MKTHQLSKNRALPASKKGEQVRKKKQLAAQNPPNKKAFASFLESPKTTSPTPQPDSPQNHEAPEAAGVFAALFEEDTTLEDATEMDRQEEGLHQEELSDSGRLDKIMEEQSEQGRQEQSGSDERNQEKHQTHKEVGQVAWQHHDIQATQEVRAKESVIGSGASGRIGETMAKEILKGAFVGHDLKARKVVMLEVEIPGRGKARVRVRKEGEGRVSIRIRAENGDLARTLERGRGELRKELSGRDVQLESLEIVG